jgi:glycyl-tRNA synthetase
MKFSGQDLQYIDQNGEKFIPWILETSMGLGRVFLAVISNAYCEDEMGGEKRVVLKLAPHLAPVKVAVFPLLKNKPELQTKAREVFSALKKEFGAVIYDESGTVGKRYRRQDEIGTPFCITVDFDTIEKDNTVTVRDRDTGEQERVTVDQLSLFIKGKIS